MSFLSSSSPVALLALQAQIVTLNTEDFVGASSGWSWATPGALDPGTAFQPVTGATPSSTTGPNGGSNPIIRSVEPSNPYGYTEATNSAGPFTIESPVFDASKGTHTLTFDYFARFGTEGGIDDGEVEVFGFDGASLVKISNSIIGSQQTTANDDWRPSTEFGTYSSVGFTNADFQFLIKCTKGLSTFTGNYDFCFDNLKVTGPGQAVVIPPPSGTQRAIAILLGNRTIFVSKSGNDANTGLSEGQAKRTVQNAISTANRGDVVLVDDGTYYEGLSISNSGATVAEPILIAAKNPGQVIVSNLIQSVREGTATWVDRGSGVFGLPGAGRSFLGYDVVTRDFIPGLRSASDVNATTMGTNFGTNQQNPTTNKPQYGMSVSGSELRLKLKGGLNPNGRQLAITDGFSKTLFSINNSPNTIVDGIEFDGAGDGFAVSIDLSSDNCVLTNCKFFTCQFGVKPGDNTLIDNCEYSQIGVTQWRRDLNAVNGGDSSTAVFRWAKNHYVGDIVGSNTSNALVEGGIDGGNFNATAASGVRITGCWIHDAFEGSKIGRSKNSQIDNCRIEAIMDDAVEAETAGIGPNAPGQGSVVVRDNRITDCQVAVSVQDEIIQAVTRIYRNVIEVVDQGITRMPFVFKTVRTPGTTRLEIYQNTIKHISPNGNTTEGFGSHTVFFPFLASNINGGLRCTVFQNNCLIFEDLDQGSGNPNTGNIDTNVLANDDLALWRSNGGSFEGAEANLLLDSAFVPAGGSPLAGAGSPLPAGLPDSRSENTTVGAHEVGSLNDDDWPRVAAEFFRDTTPPRWTEPGAI